MIRLKIVLMLPLVAAIALASAGASTASHTQQFTYYPAFRQPAASRIEVIIDKGLISELIVNCGSGQTGILRASKVERLVCLPDHRCVGDVPTAVARLCD